MTKAEGPSAPDGPRGARAKAARRAPVRRYDHEEILRIVIGMMPVLFMAAVDQTVVSVALVAISRDLGQVELVPWVATGYLIASTVSTPVYGKLSDLFGRWPVLAVAICVFVVASTLAALAQTMPQLLAFRLLQGLGGGGLIPLAQTVVGDVAPGHLRGRYQGWLASVFAAAAVLGPIAGGLLTEYISWRAVFAAYLPLGIAGFLVARRALRTLEPIEVRRRPIDYAGALLLGVSISCLLIGLTALGGGREGLLTRVLPLFIVGVLAGVGLVAWERRAPEPILPPSLFANRVITLCCIVGGLGVFVMIGTSVLVPMALQSMHGLRADQVALALVPLSFSAPCGSILCGKLMSRMVSFRYLLAAGQATCLLAMLLLAILMPAPGIGFGLLLVVLGLGVGLTMPATIAAAQMAVGPGLIGVATATTALTRTLGGAVGVAVLGTVLFAVLGIGGGAMTDLAAVPYDTLETGFRVTYGLTAAISALSLFTALRLPRANPMANA
ncbi:MAG: MFS transporter [Burkholderiaceae bacterium]